jgi:hypothetical protein
MKRRIASTVIVSAILFALVSSFLAVRVNASTTWTVNLQASLGVYSSTTVLGVASDATDGFDTTYDAIAPIAPPTGVYSYFYYPSNPSTPVDYRKLSTSIIPPSDSMNWTLRIQPFGLDGTMKLNWTAIPAQIDQAYIMDSTGTTILANMKLVTEYSYAASDSMMVVFRVSFFVIPEFPIGAIVAVVACFVSYGAFKSLKRISYPIA